MKIILPIDSKQTYFDYLAFQLGDEPLPHPSTTQTSTLLRLTPKIYQFEELGMFCKFDVALDAGSKIPLRFRLGTVGGVDVQERKGPTRYNY